MSSQIKRAAFIGTRELSIPEKVLAVSFGYHCQSLGIALYSGEAPGSDACFASGALRFCKELSEQFQGKLVIPWKGFSPRVRDVYNAEAMYLPGETEYLHALGILKASGTVPWLDNLIRKNKRGVLALYARNVWQVIDIIDWQHVDAIFYFAKESDEGVVSGGTGIAVHLARWLGIKTFNLRIPAERQRAFDLVGYHP